MSIRKWRALLVGLLAVMGMASAVPVYAQSSPMQTTSGVVFVRAMLGPLFFTNGTCAAPAISFSAEKTTGIFRNGVSDVIVCLSGVGELRVSANNIFVRSTTNIGWTNSTDAVNTPEHWLSRRVGGIALTGSSTAMQLSTVQTTAPTCVTNCGTPGNTVAGTDTAGVITLGTTPASGFVLTFNGTWTAAPSCQVVMYLAGMVAGKAPLTVATTTTNFTVVTNGTAPATSDKYSYVCVGIQ